MTTYLVACATCGWVIEMGKATRIDYRHFCDEKCVSAYNPNTLMHVVRHRWSSIELQAELMRQQNEADGSD